MKLKITQLVSSLVLLGAASCSAPTYQQPDAPIQEVPFTQVQFNDPFWSPRIEINRTVSIPSAFHQCEINGRFDNFAIAGGLMKGEHKGDFSFDDTDPYKIIEGASYSLAVQYDEKLDHYLDSVISIIAAAQEPDGYLTTCVTNKCYRLSGWWGRSRWEKMNSHELYNSGHLYEAAVAHYRATGKRSLLDVAIKNADLVCKTFGLGDDQIHYPSGHPIIEMALAKLYKVTGDQKYLDEARYFVEETGRFSNGRKPSEYSQDHMPILEQEEIVGHAVRAGYLYSGVADVAALTNDTAYFNAIQRVWENMSSKKLYITGGIGSRPQGEGFGPNYELSNHTGYCETCASISNVYWNHRMFLATGEAKYYDIVERALYNGVMSGVSLSGDRFFYDNPLQSLGEHDRAEWFGCACCPGNVTRFVASVPNYIYATQGTDVYVNLYVQGEAEMETALGKVKIAQTTEYPWQGKVAIQVTPETEGQFAVRLRIPSWVKDAPANNDLYTYINKVGNYTLKVNGSSVTPAEGDGYATIARTWKAGDVIELDFPMEVRRIQSHDEVEVNRGKLAIERGPIVYCLEGQDQADGKVFNKFIPADTQMDAAFDAELLNGVVVLTGTAKEVDLDGNVKDVPFKAIPYSTWNNRGRDHMVVWVAANQETALPTPEPTIASKAKAFVNQAPIQNDAPESASTLEETWGTNDQMEPKRSSDISTPYQYWWRKTGSLEALAYEFDQPYTVSNVQVYWLDFDHYDGDFRVPASWKLYYKVGNTWKEVEALNDYGVKKDCYNSVDFKPVKTTGLKIAAQLQQGVSGGVIEWRVK